MGFDSSNAIPIGVKVISGATAGSVLFAGTGGVIQQDNANLFWDDTNNRLGLGTALPSAQFHAVQPALTTGSPTMVLWTGGAHTTLTASTEATDINYNLARTVQFATGGITLQRSIRVQAPTYAFVGASTINTAATFAVSGPPAAGTNATITRAYSIMSEDGDVCFTSATNGAMTVDFLGAGGTGSSKIVNFKGALTASSTNTNFVFNTVATTRTAGKLVEFRNNATEKFSVAWDGAVVLTQSANTSGSPTLLSLSAAAHTTLAASVEAVDVNFNLNRTVQFSTGALTTQRAVLIQAPTYAFVGASTLTNAATFAITGAPVAGANATITNGYALWVQAGVSRFESKLSFDATMTAGGTTGAQTINKPSGSVNFAAAATTLVVTNNLVTTNSIVMVVLNTNDATAALKDVEIASGSFTIRLTAAATAETKASFFVIN